MAFLNEDGLSHLIEKIKTYIKSATVKKAESADKLTTARTIKIGGYAGGTAKSFDGSANIELPITEVDNAALKWGTSGDTAGGVSPLGVSLISQFNANRISFLDPKFITGEFSTDGGQTWTEETSEITSNIVNKKQSLTVSYAANFFIGNKKNDAATLNDQYRLTINNRPLEDGTNPNLYCNIRKIFIFITTNGATNCKVKIEQATIGDQTTWTEVKTASISGWSGWNEINVGNLIFGGSTSQTYQIAKLRFTFSIGGLSSNTTYKNNLMINGLWFCGENGFNTPSRLARNGHLYDIEPSTKRAIFPGGITAGNIIIGTLSGNATSATKATNDGDGNIISKTYLKKSDYTDIAADTLILDGGLAAGNT